MKVQNVAVVGAGQMGNGIAQVLAQFEYQVLLFDVNAQALEKAIKTITTSCDKFIAKEKMTEAAKKTLLARIQTTTSLKDLSKSDFVIEAATENIDLKLKIFKDLDEVCKTDAILVTNTSSISITKIAAATKRPQQVAGMHFMNPVPLMKLVEGIRGLQTSDETFKAVTELAQKLDKTFIVSRDMPGFIVNRILMPMINEASYALYEGIADVEGIDQAMKLGTNQP